MRNLTPGNIVNMENSLEIVEAGSEAQEVEIIAELGPINEIEEEFGMSTNRTKK